MLSALMVASLTVGLLSWLLWRIKHKSLLDVSDKLPGPPPLPIVGNALAFMLCEQNQFINYVNKMTRQYGDVMRVWLGPDLNVFVSDPDDLRILLSSPKTSVKGVQYKYMADVLGGGILSGSGPSWRRHRKIANPNYGKRAIEGYSDIFHLEVQQLLRTFQKLPAGKQFNIYEPIVQTTSYTVCQTLMGLSRGETLDLPRLQEIIDLSPKLYDVVFERMTKWWQQIDPVFWMTHSYQLQKYFIKIMFAFSQAIVDNRLKRLQELGDEKIQEIMSADEDSKDNTKLSVIDRFILSSELNRDELLRETFTIFTSSQEATAKISSFLLLMLAYHPDNQERLYLEIMEVVGDEDGPITDEHFKRMPYLEMVFKEVLRMFPIGALLQRSITEDISINNKVTLPAGCSLVIPIYHIQRDPRFWDNPEYFDPERFNHENTKKRHPYAYIPFSLGPMDCLGRHFGTKLVKTIAVQVLRNYKVETTEKYEDMVLTIAVSVSSVHGHNVSLTPRK